MNLSDPLRRIARERPAGVAIVRSRGAPLAWRDFDRLVDALAHRCLDAGILPGDIVHLAVRRPFRQLVLELALMRIGAAASASSLPATIATACLVEDAQDARVHPKARFVDASWFDQDAQATVTAIRSHAGDDALAIVCPSSGTTGIPKAIPVTHIQLGARIAAANAGVPLPAAPRVICAPSPASGYGIVSALRALWAGGTLVFAATPEEIVASATDHAVNHIVMMPYWIDRLVAALPVGGRLPALEQIELGGAFVPRALHDLARERLCGRLHSVYGATEAGCIAMGPCDGLDLESGEVGRVLPGIEIAAFDRSGRRLPAGEEGVLRVRGGVCSSRYVGDSAATAETFVDGWLVTPDVGHVGADGMVTLAGRLGELIVVGGYKVRPSVVEGALMSLPSIEDAAAFGATGDDGVTQLCAAVVARQPLDRAALDAALRARLRGYTPSFVMQVPRVPRNAGGKIMRDQLVSMARAAGLASRL